MRTFVEKSANVLHESVSRFCVCGFITHCAARPRIQSLAEMLCYVTEIPCTINTNKENAFWDQGLHRLYPQTTRVRFNVRQDVLIRFPKDSNPPDSWLLSSLYGSTIWQTACRGSYQNSRVIRKVFSSISSSWDFTTIPLTRYWNSFQVVTHDHLTRLSRVGSRC